ncbi:hypothetical protein [Micromonospora sp. U21]|uniref:hypothetical protein n=1 Tax=Micromonospora sp. U21 TaxID=2824899 RepID=UPI001B36D177|nr:hypothetical protein [Micromonospora sp. U21]MBQ0905775.1 hypothetical protein [Micromonospora sp. U21]
MPDNLDQWHDFRKSVALVSMVLFLFCVVGLGFLAYRLAIVGDDGTFNGWSFFRFMSPPSPPRPPRQKVTNPVSAWVHDQPGQRQRRSGDFIRS